MDPAIGAAVIGGFFTLAAGGAAVVAAYIVGSRQGDIASRQADIQDRQAGISERQTEIQERQVDLVDTSNRIELFDRRMTLYHDTQKYLESFVICDIDKDGEFLVLEELFYRHLNESIFLFDETVFKWMEDISKNKIEYCSMVNLTERLPHSIKAHDAFTKQVELIEWSDKQRASMQQTFSKFLTLTVRSSPREGAVAHAIRLAKTL